MAKNLCPADIVFRCPATREKHMFHIRGFLPSGWKRNEDVGPSGVVPRRRYANTSVPTRCRHCDVAFWGPPDRPLFYRATYGRAHESDRLTHSLASTARARNPIEQIHHESWERGEELESLWHNAPITSIENDSTLLCFLCATDDPWTWVGRSIFGPRGRSKATPVSHWHPTHVFYIKRMSLESQSATSDIEDTKEKKNVTEICR